MIRFYSTGKAIAVDHDHTQAGRVIWQDEATIELLMEEGQGAKAGEISE